MYLKILYDLLDKQEKSLVEKVDQQQKEILDLSKQKQFYLPGIIVDFDQSRKIFSKEMHNFFKSLFSGNIEELLKNYDKADASNQWFFDQLKKCVTCPDLQETSFTMILKESIIKWWQLQLKRRELQLIKQNLTMVLPYIKDVNKDDHNKIIFTKIDIDAGYKDKYINIEYRLKLQDDKKHLKILKKDFYGKSNEKKPRKNDISEIRKNVLLKMFSGKPGVNKDRSISSLNSINNLVEDIVDDLCYLDLDMEMCSSYMPPANDISKIKEAPGYESFVEEKHELLTLEGLCNDLQERWRSFELLYDEIPEKHSHVFQHHKNIISREKDRIKRENISHISYEYVAILIFIATAKSEITIHKDKFLRKNSKKQMMALRKLRMAFVTGNDLQKILVYPRYRFLFQQLNNIVNLIVKIKNYPKLLQSMSYIFNNYASSIERLSKQFLYKKTNNKIPENFPEKIQRLSLHFNKKIKEVWAKAPWHVKKYHNIRDRKKIGQVNLLNNNEHTQDEKCRKEIDTEKEKISKKIKDECEKYTKKLEYKVKQDWPKHRDHLLKCYNKYKENLKKIKELLGIGDDISKKVESDVVQKNYNQIKKYLLEVRDEIVSVKTLSEFTQVDVDGNPNEEKFNKDVDKLFNDVLKRVNFGEILNIPQQINEILNNSSDTLVKLHEAKLSNVSQVKSLDGYDASFQSFKDALANYKKGMSIWKTRWDRYSKVKKLEKALKSVEKEIKGNKNNSNNSNKSYKEQFNLLELARAIKKQMGKKGFLKKSWGRERNKSELYIILDDLDQEIREKSHKNLQYLRSFKNIDDKNVDSEIKEIEFFVGMIPQTRSELEKFFMTDADTVLQVILGYQSYLVQNAGIGKKHFEALNQLINKVLTVCEKDNKKPLALALSKKLQPVYNELKKWFSGSNGKIDKSLFANLNSLEKSRVHYFIYQQLKQLPKNEPVLLWEKLLPIYHLLMQQQDKDEKLLEIIEQKLLAALIPYEKSISKTQEHFNKFNEFKIEHQDFKRNVEEKIEEFAGFMFFDPSYRTKENIQYFMDNGFKFFEFNKVVYPEGLHQKGQITFGACVQLLEFIKDYNELSADEYVLIQDFLGKKTIVSGDNNGQNKIDFRDEKLVDLVKNLLRKHINTLLKVGYKPDVKINELLQQIDTKYYLHKQLGPNQQSEPNLLTFAVDEILKSKNLLQDLEKVNTIKGIRDLLSLWDKITPEDRNNDYVYDNKNLVKVLKNYNYFNKKVKLILEKHAESVKKDIKSLSDDDVKLILVNEGVMFEYKDKSYSIGIEGYIAVLNRFCGFNNLSQSDFEHAKKMINKIEQQELTEKQKQEIQSIKDKLPRLLLKNGYYNEVNSKQHVISFLKDALSGKEQLSEDGYKLLLDDSKFPEIRSDMWKYFEENCYNGAWSQSYAPFIKQYLLVDDWVQNNQAKILSHKYFLQKLIDCHDAQQAESLIDVYVHLLSEIYKGDEKINPHLPEFARSAYAKKINTFIVSIRNKNKNKEISSGVQDAIYKKFCEKGDFGLKCIYPLVCLYGKDKLQQRVDKEQVPQMIAKLRGYFIAQSKKYFLLSPDYKDVLNDIKKCYKVVSEYGTNQQVQELKLLREQLYLQYIHAANSHDYNTAKKIYTLINDLGIKSEFFNIDKIQNLISQKDISQKDEICLSVECKLILTKLNNSQLTDEKQMMFDVFKADLKYVDNSDKNRLDRLYWLYNQIKSWNNYGYNEELDQLVGCNKEFKEFVNKKNREIEIQKCAKKYSNLISEGLEKILNNEKLKRSDLEKLILPALPNGLKEIKLNISSDKKQQLLKLLPKKELVVRGSYGGSVNGLVIAKHSRKNVRKNIMAVIRFVLTEDKITSSDIEKYNIKLCKLVPTAKLHNYKLSKSIGGVLVKNHETKRLLWLIDRESHGLHYNDYLVLKTHCANKTYFDKVKNKIQKAVDNSAENCFKMLKKHFGKKDTSRVEEPSKKFQYHNPMYNKTGGRIIDGLIGSITNLFKKKSKPINKKDKKGLNILDNPNLIYAYKFLQDYDKDQNNSKNYLMQLNKYIQVDSLTNLFKRKSNLTVNKLTVKEKKSEMNNGKESKKQNTLVFKK
ncbi:MAG: hypothetical protein PVI75_07545 [Gammaproteobacteria bacterium]|jgi:hypothetical protein